MQSPAQFRIECNAQTVNTDALLIFWNPEMEKQHGFFSTQIVQQVMEKLAENDGQNLPKTKLNPGQCVESPPFQWKKHDVKVMYHSALETTNVKEILQENSLRLAYLYAIEKAHRSKLNSICLPVVLSDTPGKDHKISCSILMQAICYFVTQNPTTTVRRYLIVTDTVRDNQYVTRKCKTVEKPCSVSAFLKLQKKVEKKAKGAVMVSAAFNGRFFADVMKWRNFLGNGVKKMTEASNYNNVIWNLLETTLSCNKKPNVDSVENMEIDVTPTKAAKENVTDDMQPANEPSTTPRTPSSNRRLLKLRKREQ
uniref:Macro domain-containing protein n=1 Tax=Caenorhabditis japonica TaxID=281687 RepID=A0A8R1E780_CAEJA